MCTLATFMTGNSRSHLETKSGATSASSKRALFPDWKWASRLCHLKSIDCGTGITMGSIPACRRALSRASHMPMEVQLCSQLVDEASQRCTMLARRTWVASMFVGYSDWHAEANGTTRRSERAGLAQEQREAR